MNIQSDVNSVGKLVGENLYLHTAALDLLPAQSQDSIALAASLAQLSVAEHFNVVKLHQVQSVFPD